MGKESIGGTGERFRQIANQLFDGNKSELARSLDMKPSSFAKYTDGSRRPGSKVLERLSRLGVNINWFLSGEGEMMDETMRERPSEPPSTIFSASAVKDESAFALSEDPTSERFVRIPVVRVRDAENGVADMEEEEGVACLSVSFIRQRYGVEPHQLREFRVSGDAMGQTIRPGDRLLVEIGGCDSLVDGVICLVDSPTGVLVRRIRLQAETVVLVADRSSVADLEVSLEEWEEKYRPLARAVEVVRSV